jgi:hypothetical protein
MLSERSKLSGTGCEVVEELAINLKGDFDKLSDQLVPPLLKLCARTNKVMVQRASKTLNQIIVSCAHLKFVHKFADAMANQSKSLRVIVAGALKLLLENTHAHTITMELVAEIEKVIRLGLTDAEPAARERSRASYHLYCEYFPDRVHEFIKTLDSTTKKYLSDRTGDSGKRQPLLSSRSTPSSPEKAVAPTARVQLERPARTTGLLSLGAKPQRIINGVANQDNNINRLKESSANVLLSKPQRVTSAEMPKTAPGKLSD